MIAGGIADSFSVTERGFRGSPPFTGRGSRGSLLRLRDADCAEGHGTRIARSPFDYGTRITRISTGNHGTRIARISSVTGRGSRGCLLITARGLRGFLLVTGRGSRGSRLVTGRGSRGSLLVTGRGSRGSLLVTGRGSRGFLLVTGRGSRGSLLVHGTRITRISYFTPGRELRPLATGPPHRWSKRGLTPTRYRTPKRKARAIGAARPE